MGVKIFISLLIFTIVFISGCNTTNSDNIYNNCMIGCFAGMNYNGSEIIEVDIENINQEQLEEFVACENFCKVYTNEVKEGRMQ